MEDFEKNTDATNDSLNSANDAAESNDTNAKAEKAPEIIDRNLDYLKMRQAEEAARYENQPTQPMQIEPQYRPEPAPQWQPQWTQPSVQQPRQDFVPGYGQPQAPRPDPEYRPESPVSAGYVPMNSVPPYGSAPMFNHSGEYRYVPPYAQRAENVRPDPQYVKVPGFDGVAPGYTDEKKEKRKKKEKNKKSFSSGAIAVILIASLLLSFASGLGGAYLFSSSGKSSVSHSSSSDEPMVVYKSVKPDKDENSDEKDENLTISDVSATVAESVVEITTEFNQSYGLYQWVNKGAGSGVIISDNGYIITNNHVIVDTENTGNVADDITVRLSNGKEYTAELIGTDADSDIAVIKIDEKDLSPAIVGDSSSIKVGEQVIAVGNPLGSLGGTVTSGIISSTSREISVDSNRMNLIQIDAAVNPGNSGGGLFNIKGELIGIVNAKYSDTGVEGLGFAIPVNDAVDVATELRENGYVTGKVFIGISYYDANDAFTSYYYFSSDQPGVYIAQVLEGYNDDVLEYGDRITAVDGNEITSSEDLKAAIKEHEVGDKIKMTVSRKGKIIEVEVTCYEYVPDDKPAQKGKKK